MQRIRCALCNLDDDKVIATLGWSKLCPRGNLSYPEEGFNVVQCNRCGLIYLNPRHDLDELKKYYAAEYRQSRTTWIQKLSIVLNNYKRALEVSKLKSKGRILDIGCGQGEFLFHMKKRGWETYGLDSSEHAYQIARDKLREDVYHCELEDCRFPDNYFDVVTLWSVLEHLPTPNQTLREINRILKPKGILVIEVPNIEEEVIVSNRVSLGIPSHLIFYSPKTLGAILEKNGFAISGQKDTAWRSIFSTLKQRCKTGFLPLTVSHLLMMIFTLGSIALTAFFDPKQLPHWGPIRAYASKEL